jgi:sulfite reductase (ferredoxin)
MQSFRSEIENPIVQKDILELEQKIAKFKLGEIDEEKFRSLRLARGVYGQRQPGVQMIRIKIPFGKMTTKQLRRICKVSDEYSIGRLHTTTRQDIQIHYVSLDRTPELWAELEKDDVTLREACGNTVRNVTAAFDAGINPNELFDVSPYAQGIFKYFLRNPICQEMGRKFKIAISATEKDEAFTFMHDIGLIPKVKEGVRGFKVMLAGGLGAQGRVADVAYEFLEEDKVIPFIEATLRIFDRYGERSKRQKARIKFLLKDWGLEKFMEEVEKVMPSVANKSVAFDLDAVPTGPNPNYKAVPEFKLENEQEYQDWLRGNVVEQKQKGYYCVRIKLTNGDFYTDQARKLADLVDGYAADDIRVTVNQGLALKFVQKDALPYVFQELKNMGLAKIGFDGVADVTACPGTDTCNLGISDSVNTSVVIEKFIEKEYKDLVFNNDIKIKISGCMNSCGQHSLASIGFHGGTMKKDGRVLPALQVLVGGGPTGDGGGVISDKVIKVPSKRVLHVIKAILDDYEDKKVEGEYFHSYAVRMEQEEQRYFYNMLKEFADLDNLTDSDYIDWGHDEEYVKQIGIGECAGVVIDLVATLFMDVEEKLQNAKDTFKEGRYADSIYHSYSSLINAGKAGLTSLGTATNTQAGIVQLVDEELIEKNSLLQLDSSFADLVFQMNDQAPSKEFAEKYMNEAHDFYNKLLKMREAQLQNN